MTSNLKQNSMKSINCGRKYSKRYVTDIAALLTENIRNVRQNMIEDPAPPPNAFAAIRSFLALQYKMYRKKTASLSAYDSGYSKTSSKRPCMPSGLPKFNISARRK